MKNLQLSEITTKSIIEIVKREVINSLDEVFCDIAHEVCVDVCDNELTDILTDIVEDVLCRLQPDVETFIKNWSTVAVSQPKAKPKKKPAVIK